MDAKDLIQARLRHEMSMNFFRDLLSGGKLNKAEFEKAAKLVDEKCNIENLEIELGKLRYQSKQSNPVEAECGLMRLPT